MCGQKTAKDYFQLGHLGNWVWKAELDLIWEGNILGKWIRINWYNMDNNKYSSIKLSFYLFIYLVCVCVCVCVYARAHTHVHTYITVFLCQKTIFFFLIYFLLDIFFIYISNVFPKVPYTLFPPCSPTHPLPLLGLAFPCTGAYKVCNTKGSLLPVMAD